jgi:hypothetical protein
MGHFWVDRGLVVSQTTSIEESAEYAVKYVDPKNDSIDHN